ncbi:tyrosine--tRNA ligase, partial [Patescibacteria group bacterium]|nr:tyrosine--tRNA ligase [Patescibacteria group bacterium]
MAVSTDQEKIDQLLTRGVEAIYPSQQALEEILQSGKRIRVYVGFDPTAPELHIGHALQLRKLREFQELGHEVILLIGSFTAMIGDPTDKLAARKQLTQKEVLSNAATYKKQASKILSFSGRNAVKLMFNHKWLSKMTFQEVIELASHFTVQQMSERDMFERRIKQGEPVYLHEFLYPLMQGYDSVAMDVDLEIGGSDQTFNMLTGRTLMKRFKDKEKFVMALKLLVTAEGKKMSKTEAGFIALSDAPEEMYGKLMAMDDSMILPYFELASDLSIEEVEGIRLGLERGMNPRDAKARLAKAVVEMFHGEQSAKKAEEHFEKVFKRHEAPDEMPEVSVPSEQDIVDLLVKSELAQSKGEARRLLEQKAIKVDGVVVDSINTKLVGKEGGV